MIFYEDVSVRDGAQQIGITNTYDSIKEISNIIASSGIQRIEYKIIASETDVVHFIETYQKHTAIKFSLLTLPTEATKSHYKKMLQSVNQEHGRLNIKFLFPVSQEHLVHKLKTNEDQFLKQVKEFYEALDLVKCSVILEDASSVPTEDLISLCTKITEALNVSSLVYADTKGILIPSEVEANIKAMKNKFPTIDIGFHGHNDLGCAVANAISAVTAGASIIEGTFLGIGERAGNVALEELEVALSYKGIRTEGGG